MQFLAWVWFGLILGVSFLATPAKFLAETLTRPAALEVGRVTFRILDRLEWGLIAILLALAYARWRRGALSSRVRWLVAALFVTVLIQSVYFLPILDARVGMVMAGEDLPPSHLHTVSGAFEVLQAAALLWLGWLAPPLKDEAPDGPPQTLIGEDERG